MTWVRIDDAAPLHPKLLRAGAEAAWLWVAGLAYANRHVTDGVVPREALPALYPHDDLGRAKLLRLAERLVEVGMWSPREGGGWLIHGYAEYQREAMRDSVEERRRWESERKARQRANARTKSDTSDSETLAEMSHRDRGGTEGGTSVGHVPGHDVGHSVGHVPGVSPPVSQVVSQAPDPSRPVPTKEETLSLAPPAPATVTPRPARKREPADPPPFSMASAFEALATEARGRFVSGTERDWTKGHRIAVAKAVRTYSDLAMWRRLGRWLASGGDAYRGEVGPSWAASNALADAMARAAAWEANGGGPIGRTGNVAPAPPAPSAPRAPHVPDMPRGPIVTAAERSAARAALLSAIAPKEVS